MCSSHSLTDWASTIPGNIRDRQSGTWKISGEHLQSFNKDIKTKTKTTKSRGLENKHRKKDCDGYDDMMQGLVYSMNCINCKEPINKTDAWRYRY